MKRLGDKGTDALTILHKLVGLGWVVSAVGVLAMAIVAMGDGGSWERISAFQRWGGIASVVTFGIGLIYGAATPWGFVRERLVLVKWGLFLLATAVAGYAMPAAREADALRVALLTGALLVALLASAGIGIVLERRRHADPAR